MPRPKTAKPSLSATPAAESSTLDSRFKASDESGTDLRRTVLWAFAVAALILAAYAGVIRDKAFGPEFCSFYWWNYKLSLSEILEIYWTSPGSGWYRPTSFNLPYWMFRHFVDWRNVAGWKLLQCLTLILSAWGIGWITLLVFPGQRLAAALAAFYFAVYPGCYSILLQNSAFDFLHVVLVTGSVGCYLIARRSEHTWRWITAAALFYAAALTSKEITVVTPVYLAVISVLSLWWEKSDQPLMRRIRREVLLLAPFILLLGAYYLVHVRRMPPYPVDAQYRTRISIPYIKQNLAKYPLWMARIYSGTGDTHFQTIGYDYPHTLYAGLFFLVLTFSQWLHDLRSDRSIRPRFLLLFAWATVFAIVPIYSGSFLWHINLAVAGYAMLFGVAMARLIDSLRWRPLAIAVPFLLLLVLGRWNGDDTIHRAVHATQYKVQRAVLANDPPVPESRIGPSAVVLYEDRARLGNWAFGGGDNLFKWFYQRPDIEEKSVPSMQQVSGDLMAKWLGRPGSVFFIHDDEFRWRDVSAVFQNHVLSTLAGYTNDLLSKGRNREVFDALDAVVKRTDIPVPLLLYYHHGVAAHRVKQYDAAMRSFDRSLSLDPRFPLAFLNRGYVHLETGRRQQACEDFRRALELDPKDNGIRRLIGEVCR